MSALLAVAIQHWVSLRWQSFSGDWLWYVRHADSFSQCIKRIGPVSPVTADQGGSGRRGSQDRITAVAVVGAMGAETIGSGNL